MGYSVGLSDSERLELSLNLWTLHLAGGLGVVETYTTFWTRTRTLDVAISIAAAMHCRRPAAGSSAPGPA